VRGEASNCKAAEDAKKSGAEEKIETRNPKFETISNDQNQNVPNKPVLEFVIGFDSSSLFRISIRISDLIGDCLAGWRDGTIGRKSWGKAISSQGTCVAKTKPI
jgi:hypothetical protein